MDAPNDVVEFVGVHVLYTLHDPKELGLLISVLEDIAAQSDWIHLSLHCCNVNWVKIVGVSIHPSWALKTVLFALAHSSIFWLQFLPSHPFGHAHE